MNLLSKATWIRISNFIPLFIMPLLTFAQFSEGEDKIEELQEFMQRIAPMAFVVVLLVGAIFNIRKVWGQDSDWKGFFSSIGLFVLAVGLVAAAVAWIASLNFG